MLALCLCTPQGVWFFEFRLASSKASYTWSTGGTDHLLQSIFYSDPMLRRKEKLAVGRNDNPKYDLLHYYHNSSLGGHPGVQAMVCAYPQPFILRGPWKDVCNFIQSCTTCNLPKLSAWLILCCFNYHHFHLVFSLTILLRVAFLQWPSCQLFSCWLLTKYSHLMSLSHFLTLLTL